MNAPLVPAALERALAGRYRLERELGRGGMAVVYLARDLKHDRPVALKVLRGELAASVGTERFLREIAIAARLQHPNILTLIDSGESADPAGSDRFVWYVMPFVEGESLRDRLARQGAMTPAHALPLLREIVDGMASAHRLGIVHRDIKPDNILLTQHHALVVDFGIAKAMKDARGSAAITEAGMSLGTPAYMAPEQVAADASIDHRADIYSAGVVAYEMLAGTPPFTGTPQAVMAGHISGTPRPLAAPARVQRLVMRCLAKSPEARYQTADEMLDAIDELSTDRPRNRPLVAGIAMVVLVAVAAFTLAGLRLRRQSWVHGEALPAIIRLVDVGNPDSAYAIARRAETVLPGDSILHALWPRFARRVSFETEPAGGTVSRARFDDTTHWEVLGTTPLDTVWIPAAVDRYRITKPGYRPALLLAGGIDRVTSPGVPRLITLQAAGGPDSEMVRIPGGDLGVDLAGMSAVPEIPLGDFLIERHEVTNREFKRFVDAGGYAKREWWDSTFVKDGKALGWADASRFFVDRTGRTGPATWEAGDIPTGQENLPVGGLSWYEARAYARFAGMALPTVRHWSQAAGITAAAFVTPGSNFDGRGPAPGGSFRGMSPWGVFDMAGNVREWCDNDDGLGRRYILGGGWNDNPYIFTDAYTQAPFDRSVTNGVRLVKFLTDEPRLAAAREPIRTHFRDFTKERPAGDAVYAGYLRQFDYDRTPLDARIERRDTTDADWISEQVSFAAAYEHDRVLLTLYLPRHAKPPYQTVVFFPPGNAVFARVSNDDYARRADYLIKGGRAFAVPVFLGTFERHDGLASDNPDSTITYRDHVVAWGKDLRRTLDYLSTRPDLDSTRFAYDGISFGGRMGGVMLAVEPRFRAAVLEVAGLKMAPQRPEIDALHYVSRIRTPVLMLNGKYDFFFPVEVSQLPFFNLLGTPPADKRHVLFEGGHLVPRTVLIAEALAWLDKYLGPVTLR